MTREAVTIDQEAPPPPKKKVRRKAAKKKTPSKELAVPPVTNMLQLIERIVTMPDMNVDAIERMLAMQERIDDKAAEKSFNLSMMQAQRNMPIVPEDRTNDQTHSTYASYEQILRYTKPIYTDAGFSVTFSEGDARKEEDVRVVCELRHADGHKEVYHTDTPLDNAGIKGNINKTPTHAKGSSLSYGKGYLIRMIFNIPTGDDDDDGNAAGGEVNPFITGEQADNINTLLEQHGIDKTRFLSWLAGPPVKADSIGAIYPVAYDAVIGRINSAIRAEEAPETAE